MTKIKMPNEYHREFLKLNIQLPFNGWHPGLYETRNQFVCKYAWAIPNQAALDTLKKYGPIVEMGAGNGYWAHCMRNEGIDVIAYDSVPGERYQTLDGYVTPYHAGTGWTEVLKGDPEDLSKHANRALFLCWPPYNEPMATFSLDHYKGDTVIYVGEEPGGCTGDDVFFETLRVEWRKVRTVKIPQWPQVHDSMMVFKRKKKT